MLVEVLIVPCYEYFLTSYNTDKIECDFENGGCEETCINTVGSYYCHCDVPNKLAVDDRSCVGKGSKTYIGINYCCYCNTFQDKI